MTVQIDKTKAQAEEFAKNTASQIPTDIPKLLEAMPLMSSVVQNVAR